MVIASQYVRRSAAPAPPIEGEYTTWTKQWVLNLPDGVNYCAMGYWIDDEKDVIHVVWEDDFGHYRYAVLRCADGSAIFTSPKGTHYVISAPVFTPTYVHSFATYHVHLRWDGYTLEVWRGTADAPIWSRDTRLDDPGWKICGFEISKSGKYILTNKESTEARIMLYKGS